MTSHYWGKFSIHFKSFCSIHFSIAVELFLLKKKRGGKGATCRPLYSSISHCLSVVLFRASFTNLLPPLASLQKRQEQKQAPSRSNFSRVLWAYSIAEVCRAGVSTKEDDAFLEAVNLNPVKNVVADQQICPRMASIVLSKTEILGIDYKVEIYSVNANKKDFIRH